MSSVSLDQGLASFCGARRCTSRGIPCLALSWRRIAFSVQLSGQTPQPMQRTGSITACSSRMEIAANGQLVTHVPHAVHFFRLTMARYPEGANSWMDSFKRMDFRLLWTSIPLQQQEQQLQMA